MAQNCDNNNSTGTAYDRKIASIIEKGEPVRPFQVEDEFDDLSLPRRTRSYSAPAHVQSTENDAFSFRRLPVMKPFRKMQARWLEIESQRGVLHAPAGSTIYRTRMTHADLPVVPPHLLPKRTFKTDRERAELESLYAGGTDVLYAVPADGSSFVPASHPYPPIWKVWPLGEAKRPFAALTLGNVLHDMRAERELQEEQEKQRKEQEEQERQNQVDSLNGQFAARQNAMTQEYQRKLQLIIGGAVQAQSSEERQKQVEALNRQFAARQNGMTEEYQRKLQQIIGGSVLAQADVLAQSSAPNAPGSGAASAPDAPPTTLSSTSLQGAATSSAPAAPLDVGGDHDDDDFHLYLSPSPASAPNSQGTKAQQQTGAAPTLQEPTGRTVPVRMAQSSSQTVSVSRAPKLQEATGHTARVPTAESCSQTDAAVPAGQPVSVSTAPTLQQRTGHTVRVPTAQSSSQADSAVPAGPSISVPPAMPSASVANESVQDSSAAAGPSDETPTSSDIEAVILKRCPGLDEEELESERHKARNMTSQAREKALSACWKSAEFEYKVGRFLAMAREVQGNASARPTRASLEATASVCMADLPFETEEDVENAFSDPEFTASMGQYFRAKALSEAWDFTKFVEETYDAFFSDELCSVLRWEKSSRKYKHEDLKDVSPGAANWFRDMIAALYPHTLRMDQKIAMILRRTRSFRKAKLKQEQESGEEKKSKKGDGKGKRSK